MKKILFVTPSFYPLRTGGSEVFIKNLCDLLVSHFEVHVITHKGSDFDYVWNPLISTLPDHEVIENIKIHRLRCNQLKNLFFLFIKLVVFKILDRGFYTKIFSKNFIDNIYLYKGPHYIGLKKFLTINNFDYIHIGPAPYEFLIDTMKIHKKLRLKSKILFTPFIHEEIDIYSSDIFNDLYTYCDLIHPVTENEKKFIIHKFNITNFSKLKVIPLFLRIKSYETEINLIKAKSDFIENNKLESKIIILGIGGKVENFKGVEYTIKALNSLSKKYPNLILITIGESSNLKRFNLNKNFRIIELGHVSGITKNVVFSVADIFCMPSQIDSFGLVNLEAWYYKKPIVAFDIPSIKELFHEGSLLSPVRDLELLEKNLEKLIKSKSLREELGEKGFQKLMRNFTQSAVKEEYLKMFS